MAETSSTTSSGIADASGSPPRIVRRWYSGRWVFACFVVAVIVVFSTIAIGSLLVAERPRTLEFHGQIPRFALTDDAGLPMSERELVGQVTIVNFVFTRCDTICPVNSLKMARLQNESERIAKWLRFLSISVDPNYDTPERLAAYAQRYLAKRNRWRFVTGDASEIQRVVEQGFKLALDRQGQTDEHSVPNINHSGYFVLVDDTLNIRGYYDSNDPARLQQLASDARQLATAVRRGRDSAY